MGPVVLCVLNNPHGLVCHGRPGRSLSRVFLDYQMLRDPCFPSHVLTEKAAPSGAGIRPNVHCAHANVPFQVTILFSEHFKWNKYTSVSVEWQSAISCLFTQAGDPGARVPGGAARGQGHCVGGLASLLRAVDSLSQLFLLRAQFPEGLLGRGVSRPKAEGPQG